jgi:hypothetical protein
VKWIIRLDLPAQLGQNRRVVIEEYTDQKRGYIMKTRLILTCLIIALFALPPISSASEWMVFSPKQKDGATWYYDKNSISYPKNRVFLGITLPLRDGNYPMMWVRSTSDTAALLYQVEISCKERTAKMMDNNGKGIYNLDNIDYLYNRPIPPDTVLDMLRKAVCKYS